MRQQNSAIGSEQSSSHDHKSPWSFFQGRPQLAKKRRLTTNLKKPKTYGKLFWWRDFCFRRRLVRERQPSSGEKIALFFFLSVTHKIESCFKFEFEIRSVKWVSRFLGRKMTILTAEKEREGFFSVDNLFSVFQRDPRIATRRGVGRWGWETDPFEKFRNSKPMENKNSSCWWAVVVGSPHPARGTMSMRSG